MDIKDIENIEIGAMFNYPLFSSVKFTGTDDRHVILEDRHGNKKRVYKSLFADYLTAGVACADAIFAKSIVSFNGIPETPKSSHMVTKSMQDS